MAVHLPLSLELRQLVVQIIPYHDVPGIVLIELKPNMSHQQKGKG